MIRPQWVERTPSFKERVFTEAERAYCESKAQPHIHYALRFAAREAVLKALGTGFAGMGLKDVEVVNDPRTGQPKPVLRGRAAIYAAEKGIIEMHLSLSYTHNVGVASAVAITEAVRPHKEEDPDPYEELARQFKELRSVIDDLDEKILVPVIGSVMEGIGIGLILMRGGSTGGTDIAAMIIGRFWPITPGTVYIIHDLAVIGSLLLIPGKTFQDVVYGYISMLTFSFMLDYVILGQKSTVQLLIFSSKYPEIADYINNKMERGATVLKATGWYTKVDRDVLLVIVRKSEVHEITKVIKQLDPKAFLSISPANSVYGEGFEEIKAGLERKKKNAEAQN